MKPIDHRLPRWLAVLLGAGIALNGCETYQPQPLDLAGHRAAWHERSIQDLSLVAFLERHSSTRDGEPIEFDPSDGLSITEGQLVALVFNPSLRIARLGLARSEASAEFAGNWRDPYFSTNLLRILQSVPDPWVATPGIGFQIPLSGRPAAEQSAADADVKVSERRVLEAEWAVRHQVLRAWVEWSVNRARLEETERLLRSLAEPVELAARLAEAGELARNEAALFALEQAHRENLLIRMRGEVEAARQRLLKLLGLAPEAPVSLEPSLDIPAPSPGSGPDTIAAGNPSLARLRAEHAATEERVRLEIRKQLPDLTLGPLFETDGGQTRLGLFSNFTLPIFNGNRRAIAEARQDREIARAQFETTYESLVGLWSIATAEATAAAEQIVGMESNLVPLVERQLDDALRLRQLGELDVLVQLESMRRAHETKLAWIEARRARATAHIELRFLLGAPPETSVNESEEDVR